jgi:hypothetical protein
VHNVLFARHSESLFKRFDWLSVAQHKLHFPETQSDTRWRVSALMVSTLALAKLLIVNGIMSEVATAVAWRRGVH